MILKIHLIKKLMLNKDFVLNTTEYYSFIGIEFYKNFKRRYYIDDYWRISCFTCYYGTGDPINISLDNSTISILSEINDTF